MLCCLLDIPIEYPHYTVAFGYALVLIAAVAHLSDVIKQRRDAAIIKSIGCCRLSG